MNDIEKLCKLIRFNILTITTEAGTGHPTSSLSAVELMTTLFFGQFLHYNPDDPHYIFNDRVIFSKGHASPLYFSLFHAAGLVNDEKLMKYRTFESNLEGHPTPRFKYADVATGSLGQGLSVGVGMALGIKLHMKDTPLKRKPKVFVLLGDSEVAEGQIWEAAEIASHYKLNNLVGILDVNRLGQRGETMLGWAMQTYEKRFASFGWDTIVVEDGHDLKQVQHALSNAVNPRSNPVIIVAKTKKGKGVSLLEDKDDWHGKPLPKDKLVEALKELGEVDKTIRGTIAPPVIPSAVEESLANASSNKLRDPSTSLRYAQDDKIATREAYGEALANLGETDERIVVLDAEVSNSTFSDKFKKKFPERFFEMYIAEQNMISVALGLSKLGFLPYASSFAAFLTRAFDQIRMSMYSEGNIKITGSHAGVSIGYDGSSQMGLEDLSLFRSLLESTVLYPSDAVSTAALVHKAGETRGIVYIRTTREKTPVLYDAKETFVVGGSKILKQSEKDVAVVFAAGITLHEALKAYDELKKENINITVVDLYSVKPIDTSKIQDLTSKIPNIIVVEDHYPVGGLGDAVCSVILSVAEGSPTNVGHGSEIGSKRTSHSREIPRQARNDINFIHLCVRKIPRSGSPTELLHYEEIDAAAIVKAVKRVHT